MSLRTELWRWMMGLLASVGIITAGISYWHARDEAHRLFDQQLRLIALNADASGRGEAARGDSAAVPGDSATEHDPEDDFVVQVWDAAGHPLRTMAPGPDLARGQRTGFSNPDQAGARWRTYTLVSATLTVQVSQQSVVRDELAADAAWRSLYPVAITIPLAWLVLGFVINRVFARLDALTLALGRRRVLEQKPIPMDGAPTELRPLVAAVNDALTQQSRFISSAAHTLRTPLTALQLQAANLRRALGTSDASARLDDLERGVRRAVELTRQLLRLGRSQERGAARALEPVELAEIVREVVGGLLPLADQKGQDVGFTRSDAGAVLAEPEDLRCLIGNLLENAILYTLPGGTIDLSVIADDETLVLDVRDTGPGIADADMQRVFAPFERGDAHETQGSGLGLSIVASIAERYGAHVRLVNRSDRSGLVVEVAFRRHDPDAPHSALSRDG